MRFLVALFFFTVSIFSFEYHLRPYKISDNIDCFLGLSTTANRNNGGNVINSCYLTTNDGYVVIDSGPTYSYAQQAYQIMQNKKRLPVKYVINTSTQEIHLLGNEFYKERGAILIGANSYNYKSEIKLSKMITDDAFRNTRLIPLDKKIDKEYIIEVGTTKIEIKKALKDGNKYLFVTLPKQQILFVGDMLFHNSIPILDNDRLLLDWLEFLDKIEKGSWNRIISAHGVKTKNLPINSTKNYLMTIKKELIDSIKAHIEKDEAINKITMDSFKEERGYEQWHKKNIALAYNELKKRIKLASLPVASLPVSNQLNNITQKEIKVKPTLKPTPKPTLKAKPKPKSKPKPTSKPTPKVKRKKVPPITTYYSYKTAKYYAKREKKIILLKVRSNYCPFCDELDGVMQNSPSIRKIINKNFKMIYLNISMGKLPLGIEVKKIPSLVLIRPDTEEVTMTITNFKSVGELLYMLQTGVNKGVAGGYLK